MADAQGAAGDRRANAVSEGQGGMADAQGAAGDRRANAVSEGQGRRIFLFVYRSIIKCFLVDFSVSLLSSD